MIQGHEFQLLCLMTQVWELPPGAELLASSEKTNIEIFAVENHVLGIQGHPEFTEDITLHILDLCFSEHTIEVHISLQCYKQSLH